MVKGPCWSYAYNWMVGQIDAPGHGCIIDCYTSEDGSLEAQNSEVLLGYCAWVNQLQDGTEVDPYWSWQYTGDSFTTLREEINKVAEVPETVVFKEWYLVGQIAARPLEIGFDSDKVYMRGLVSVGGIADSAIVGDWDAATSTISFPTSQYMGIYTDIRCESWFVAGTAELVQTQEG